MDTISQRASGTAGRIRVAVLLLLAGAGLVVQRSDSLLHGAPTAAERMSIVSGGPAGGEAPSGLPGLSALVTHPEGSVPGRTIRSRASSTWGTGAGLQGDPEGRRSAPRVVFEFSARLLSPGAEPPSSARDALARAGRFGAPATAPPVFPL